MYKLIEQLLEKTKTENPNVTFKEINQIMVDALEALLTVKWEVGFKDRGMGHGDFAVIAGDLVIVECPAKEIADHIAEAHNRMIKQKFKPDTTEVQLKQPKSKSQGES